MDWDEYGRVPLLFFTAAAIAQPSWDDGIAFPGTILSCLNSIDAYRHHQVRHCGMFSALVCPGKYQAAK